MATPVIVGGIGDNKHTTNQYANVTMPGHDQKTR
jgi:hypothetical protein